MKGKLFFIPLACLLAIVWIASASLAGNPPEWAGVPGPPPHAKEKIPWYTPQEEPMCEVVWPLGKWSGEVVPLPAPLTTLEGKTIASIGGAFRNDETFAELANLLSEMYPGMTFITRDEIGNPRDLGAALVELGVDAAIAGNGG